MTRQQALHGVVHSSAVAFAVFTAAASVHGQGLRVSLSDRGVVAASAPAEADALPGVRAVLSDLSGMVGGVEITSVRPAAEAGDTQPELPRFSGNVQIPFAAVAAELWRPDSRAVARSGAARIETATRDEQGPQLIQPTALEQPQEPLVMEAPAVPAVRELPRDAEAAVDGPLPQRRAMFSFATTGPQPATPPSAAATIQPVAARQVAAAGLPAMLKISVDGPRSVAAGETATFSVLTENVGDAPAHDVYLTVDSGRNAQIVACDPAAAQQQNTTAQIFLGTLEGGSLRAVSVQITVQQAGDVRLRCRTQVGDETRSAQLPADAEPPR